MQPPKYPSAKNIGLTRVCGASGKHYYRPDDEKTEGDVEDIIAIGVAMGVSRRNGPQTWPKIHHPTLQRPRALARAPAMSPRCSNVLVADVRCTGDPEEQSEEAIQPQLLHLQAHLRRLRAHPSPLALVAGEEHDADRGRGAPQPLQHR